MDDIPLPPGTDLRKRVLGLKPPGYGSSQSRPSPGLFPPGVPSTKSHTKQPIVIKSWESYWDKVETVEVPERGTFNVYVAGKEGPVIMLLHGGGYTGLTWSLFAQKLKDKYQVYAPDLRGHGLTKTGNDVDFSKETMSGDVVALWGQLFGSRDPKPATVLVGHSMGGGIAVWAAASNGIQNLAGLVVVDVVEGTALAALPYMTNVLHSRPKLFSSPEDVIGWALRSGASHNALAAAISFPSQIIRVDEAVTDQQRISPAADDDTGNNNMGSSHLGGVGGRATEAVMLERVEEAAAVTAATSTNTTPPPKAAPASPGGGGSCLWRWRTPLELTQPYWDGWYRGLSDQFLKVSAPKVLMLAGSDRLDKALTIGQMQGRFQLVLLPGAGHAIQEDEWEKTADHLVQFLHRFRVGEPPMQLPRPPVGTRPVLPLPVGPILPGPGPVPPGGPKGGGVLRTM